MITQYIKQYFFQTPPRSNGTVGAAGAVAVSTTASYIILTSLFQPVYARNTAQTAVRVGVAGDFVTFYADGADVGIIVGPTVASVTTTNAPVLATVGTLAAGLYTQAAGVAYRIPAGQERRYKLEATQDLVFGFVGSTTGVLRFFQSSGPNP